MLFTSLVLVGCGGGSSGGSASTAPAATTADTVADTVAATSTPVTDAPTTTQPATTLPATIDLAALPGRIAATSSTCGAEVLPPANSQRNSIVCTMRPDGSDVNVLSTPAQNAFSPSWNYDGAHLVFIDTNTTTIIVDRSTGQQRRRKAGDPNGLYDSPDNNWKLFLGSDGVSLGHPTVVGGATLVIPDPQVDTVASPSWAPDSRRFVYLSQGDANGGRLLCDDVWIGSVDGTPPVQITHSAGTAGADACPDSVRWSPDGSMLLLHTQSSSANGSANMYLLRPDGTGLTALTHVPDSTPDPNGDGVTPAVGAVYSPVWSPDSKYIAFVRNDGPTYGLYVMRPDGSGITQIPAPAGLAHDLNELAWAPA
jgi:Tol biopolymer transport system component